MLLVQNTLLEKKSYFKDKTKKGEKNTIDTKDILFIVNSNL